MVGKYLQYLQYEKNYSFHTVLSYESDLIQFCEFLHTNAESFTPDNVTSQHVQQWTIHLLQSNMSPRSVVRKISTLKSFWSFLVAQHWAMSNPTSRLILPKFEKSLPSFFKEKEVLAVINNPFLPTDYASVRDHLIIKLLYLAGLRCSELVNLKDTDVDFSNLNVKVQGKGNKQRIVPIEKSFAEEISKYLSLRNATIVTVAPNLFLRENGLSVYPKMVYNIVRENMSAVSKAKKRSPHTLRHSFATGLLNGGADINSVKELLGHANLAATQVYTHTSFEELRKIYKNAHPRASIAKSNEGEVDNIAVDNINKSQIF